MRREDMAVPRPAAAVDGDAEVDVPAVVAPSARLEAVDEPPSVEQMARAAHRLVVEALAKLRADRDRINGRIKPLVVEEEQLRRVVAVFDRAAEKPTTP